MKFYYFCWFGKNIFRDNKNKNSTKHIFTIIFYFEWKWEQKTIKSNTPLYTTLSLNLRHSWNKAMIFYLVQAKEQLVTSEDGSGPVMPKFVVKDLESLDGKYDTVVCLDVLIHYPQSKADGMIAHLASLANKRLILSFAPKTFYYDLLKRVGELFPGPSKATRAYLHSEADVERALQKVGWTIRKRGLTTTQFYFARLIEAVPM